MTQTISFKRLRVGKAGNHRRRSRRRLLLESLESRCLLAVSTAFMNDNWHLAADNDSSGSLTVGDLVRNDHDAVAAGTISRTYGVDAFGTVTSGLAAGQLPASLPAYDELQEAVEATSSGGTLRILPGLYSPSAALVLDQPIRLLGPQAGVDPRAGRTEGAASEAVISGQASNLLNLVRVQASGVRVEGLELTRARGDMIESLEGGNITGPTIQYNLIHHATGDDGIQLRSTTNAVIYRNKIHTTSGDAITITRSTGATIQENEVFNVYSFDAAIYAFGSTNTLVRDNLVYNSFGNDGIKLGSNTGADFDLAGGTILNNVVHDVSNGGDGIAVYSSGVRVQGNEVYNTNSVHGAISVQYAVDNVSVIDNYVHHNADAPTGTDLTAGIKIGRLNQTPVFVEVRNNRIQSNDLGILVDGSTALIENNIITGNFIGVRIMQGALVDMGSIDDPVDGNSNPTGRAAGSDSDGSSNGRNILTGYLRKEGSYAIQNLNEGAAGHPGVMAEGNIFGPIDLQDVEHMIFHAADNPALTSVDFDPLSPVLLFLDNSQPGYTETGDWVTVAGGFLGDQRIRSIQGGSASWAFNGLPDGMYRISATWPQPADPGGVATYTVFDGAVNRVTAEVDQTAAPDDFSQAGIPWEYLSESVQLSSGFLTISLAGAPDSATIADAIRIERINGPPALAVSLRDPLSEFADTSARIHLADVEIVDDDQGVSTVWLSGADVAMFELEDGKLYLKAGVALDHETAPELHVTVEVDDPEVGTSPDATAAVVIAVVDINVAPDGIALQGTSVAENQPAGALVGTFTTSDPEAPADPFVYTLVAGAGDGDNGLFRIQGDQLQTAEPLDYEAQSSYSIRVRTTDNGGMFFERSFTLQSSDANDPPYLAEPLDDAVGFVGVNFSHPVPSDAFADPDPGATFAFSASAADGSALPAWLTFNPATASFSGVPLEVGQVEVLVVAADPQDPLLRAEGSFTITVLASAHPWQNPDNPLDVNGDGLVVPLDALQIINYLNADGIGPLTIPPPDPGGPPPWLDVNGDDLASPVDVLVVINHINSTVAGEGEAVWDQEAFGRSVERVSSTGEAISAVPNAPAQPSPDPWHRSEPWGVRSSAVPAERFADPPSDLPPGGDLDWDAVLSDLAADLAAAAGQAV